MLKNVKSIYFIRMLFTYFPEKKKLELVKHNKNLQSLLNINIINYKFLTGKIFIFKTKTEIKEYQYKDIYHEKILTYEGEYLNGKRNGKGEEYDINGHKIFEGEYLNGKRNGKGKEYDYNHLIYEGEYLNGQRNGKGKECNKWGILLFKGEYLKGNKFNGKGYDKFDHIIYELKEGKGFCREYERGMKSFEGEYLNGKRNGKGKEYYYFDGYLLFEGEYLNGKRNGKGKEYQKYNGKIIFEGEYLNGYKWNGKGYIQIIIIYMN